MEEKIIQKGKIVAKRLRKIITKPESELNFSNEFELLIAVMLSAQCTDKRVNIITNELFKKYKTPYDFASLTCEELEEQIKSCNYYHNKAKNIILASQMIVDKFGGKVPSNHDDLTSLAGVGNKTANVVQAVGFNMQAFAVDTHILRVSNRLGFVNTKNPNVCEDNLKQIFDKEDWGKVHHLILLFGRYFCTARNPKCQDCVLRDLCEFIENK